MLSKVMEGFASWLLITLHKTVNTQSGLWIHYQHYEHLIRTTNR